MSMGCEEISKAYADEIEEIVNAQVEDNREAIFFIFEDGSTTKIFKGEATQISLTREEEAGIMSQGRVIGSVHTHPSGHEPSTIDVMTGIMTQQESMCVAVPVHDEDLDSNYALTCLDLSKLTFPQRHRLMRAMRRSSTGVTELGRELRKQLSLQRFKISGCRTHEVEFDGVEFPPTDRPSAVSFVIGHQVGVNDTEGKEEYIG